MLSDLTSELNENLQNISEIYNTITDNSDKIDTQLKNCKVVEKRIGTAITLTLSWDSSDIENYDGADIYIKRAEGDSSTAIDWSTVDTLASVTTTKTNSYVLSSVSAGYVYHLTFLGRNTYGGVSEEDSAPTLTYVVSALNNVPDAPVNLTVQFNRYGVLWKWTQPVDLDYAYAELRENENAGEASGLLEITQDTTSTMLPSSREGVAYLFNKGYGDKYSDPATVAYSKPIPTAPLTVTITKTFQGLTIKCSDIPEDCVGAVFSINGLQFKSQNNEYTYFATSGSFTVKVCYYDIFGNGDWSLEQSVSIIEYIDPDWLADDSLTLEKMDSVIKDAVKDAQDAIPRLDGLDGSITSINTAISDINTDVTGLQSDVSGLTTTANGLTSDLSDLTTEVTGVKQDVSGLTSTVNTHDQDISQLKQTDTQIQTTVASNKTAQDAVNTSVASQITQNADSITTVVANLNKDASDSPYESISQIKQTADGISSIVSANKTAQDSINFQVQQQLDKAISTWFYTGVPTLTNAPAKDWTDDDTKNTHIGDLYYDTNTGHGYRFLLSGSTFSWAIITDTDVTAALAAASKAQDTADGKRRVFTSTPVPPYDVGDLWTQGPTGELMRCKTAKVTGQSYVASDWDKASKYTDDTSLTTFINGVYATDKQTITSEITQNADSITAMVATLNSSPDAENQYAAISQLKLTTDSITSTVSQNKSDQATINTGFSNDISQIEQTATSISTTVAANKTAQDAINTAQDAKNTTFTGDISQIKQTATELSTTVQSNKEAQDGVNSAQSDKNDTFETDISTVTQTASQISTTVQSNKIAQDAVNTAQETTNTQTSTKITQNATSITNIVTELNKAPEDSAYSSIAQLLDNINLRVQKDDVINQINISTEDIQISGEKIHVTGETLFDNGVIIASYIGDKAIVGTKIADGTITTINIAADAITANQIGANAVTTDKLDASSVTADKISAGAITADKIDAGAVTSDKITAGAITSGKLATDSVATGNIQAGAITTDELAVNAVKAGNIAADSVTSDKISVSSLSAVSSTIGTLQTATSGARVVIKDNLITVYDSNNVLRVRMGVW
jgi:predicted  nucleic acid-binding Zn-ribbon protein